MKRAWNQIVISDSAPKLLQTKETSLDYAVYYLQSWSTGQGVYSCGEANSQRGNRRETDNPQYTRGTVLIGRKSQLYYLKP